LKSAIDWRNPLRKEHVHVQQKALRSLIAQQTAEHASLRILEQKRRQPEQPKQHERDFDDQQSDLFAAGASSLHSVQKQRRDGYQYWLWRSKQLDSLLLYAGHDCQLQIASLLFGSVVIFIFFYILFLPFGLLTEGRNNHLD
jgi:hypothetical protein